MKKKDLLKSRYAVSELLDTILILAIVTATVSSLLLIVGPYVERQKDSSHFNNVVQQFSYVNALFSDMIKGGSNSSHDFTIKIEDGTLFVNEESDILVISYALYPNCNFSVSGIDDRNNNFTVDHEGGDIKIAQADIFWLNTNENETINGVRYDAPISTTYNITDAVLVNLKNESNVVVGRIWFFDLGRLSYNLQTVDGSTIGVYLENNGVITFTSGNYMVEEPVLFIKNNSLFFRILQIRSNSNTILYGGSEYSFSAVVNKSQLLADNEEIYNLRINVYGDCNDSWNRFLEEQSLFSNGLHYWKKLNFSLLHLLFDVEVKEIT